MNRLKDMREDSDLLQSDVAKVLGVSRQYYCRYEKLQIAMPIEHYKTLAKFYHVSVDYLCGLSDQRSVSGMGLSLSEEELTILRQYRSRPEMRDAIKKLLDVK